MSAHVTVPVMQLENAMDLPLPACATDWSAGMDLLAAVDAPYLLAPSTWAKIPSGIALALPQGYEAQVRPRSGLAASHGVTVLNSPGTIDADYRGEIAVILINHGTEPFEITRGARIAQLVVAPVQVVHWDIRATLEDSARGAGGFGSTGMDSKHQPEAQG